MDLSNVVEIYIDEAKEEATVRLLNNATVTYSASRNLAEFKQLYKIITGKKFSLVHGVYHSHV